MKAMRLCVLMSALFLLQFCTEKTENKSYGGKENVAGFKYERGFVREGELLDVNYDPAIIGAFSPQTEKKISMDSLDSFFSEFKELAPYRNDLTAFYKNRDSAYAWFDDEGLTEQADHLAAKLLHLEKEGKAEKLIYQDQFQQMMDNEIDKKDEKKIELMLTSQYLWYSKRPFSGKAGELAKSADWLNSRPKFDALEAMKIAEKNGGKIFPDEPEHIHYVNLKNKILEFHKKGLDTVSAKLAVGNIKPGDSSAAIGKLRERLVMLGDLTAKTPSGKFDDEMLAAVHTFQQRNGLDSSNTVSSAFLDKLNSSGRATLEQMLLNLERMRWVSPEDGEYLMVNIPAYKLFAYDAQKFLWNMDVIVGNVNRRTVVFSDKMAYIDFAPYWNIPPGIMKRKILPAMKRSGSYLSRNHMEKTGAMAAKGIPAVRQKPGPWNALGKAKFMFPNTYNIYLHDTNEHNLFSSTDRDYSSGCVRVADAFKLAKFVLKDNKDISDSIIQKKMNADKESRVVLQKKMPVHLVYFTTWVDPQGRLVFSKDIYKRDEKLKKMLMTSPAAGKSAVPEKSTKAATKAVEPEKKA